MSYENLKPEAKTRHEIINPMLEAAGWIVQHFKTANVYADKVIEAKNNSGYRKACPKEPLERAAIQVLEATKSIGCLIANKNSDCEICCSLNESCHEFWKVPDKYQEWEKQKIENLKALLNNTGLGITIRSHSKMLPEEA